MHGHAMINTVSPDLQVAVSVGLRHAFHAADYFTNRPPAFQGARATYCTGSSITVNTPVRAELVSPCAGLA